MPVDSFAKETKAAIAIPRTYTLSLVKDADEVGRLPQKSPLSQGTMSPHVCISTHVGVMEFIFLPTK